MRYKNLWPKSDRQNENYTLVYPGRSAVFGQFYRFYYLKYIQCWICDAVASDNRLSLKIRTIKTSGLNLWMKNITLRVIKHRRWFRWKFPVLSKSKKNNMRFLPVLTFNLLNVKRLPCSPLRPPSCFRERVGEWPQTPHGQWKLSYHVGTLW